MSDFRQHGKWVADYQIVGIMCSECGWYHPPKAFDSHFFRTCPHCGATMDEKPEMGKDDVDMNTMPYEQRKAVYEKAIKNYGVNSQVWKFVEEVAELQDAICKSQDERRSLDNIAEEIADVTIMLEQLRLIFDCNDLVNEYIDKKIARLRDNMREEFPF